MQAMPHARSLPITQTPPTGHATAKAQFLGQLLPGNAGAQHEQNAVQGHLVAHSWATAFGRGNDYRQQRGNLLEQRGADFSIPVSTHASSNTNQALDDDMVLLVALKKKASLS